MPKPFKIQVVNENLAFDFVQKIKQKDKEVFAKFMKVIFQYKEKEMSYNSTCTYIERILLPYPELLEEAFLYLNHKKINSSYRKSLLNKYKMLQKNESNKKNEVEAIEKSQESPQKVVENSYNVRHNSNNPEMMFFENLRLLLENEKYTTFIKLLNLYCNVRISIINYREF